MVYIVEQIKAIEFRESLEIPVTKEEHHFIIRNEGRVAVLSVSESLSYMSVIENFGEGILTVNQQRITV